MSKKAKRTLEAIRTKLERPSIVPREDNDGVRIDNVLNEPQRGYEWRMFGVVIRKLGGLPIFECRRRCGRHGCRRLTNEGGVCQCVLNRLKKVNSWLVG